MLSEISLKEHFPHDNNNIPMSEENIMERKPKQSEYYTHFSFGTKNEIAYTNSRIVV